MLEVLEHVVERVGLASALGNAATAAAPDGMLVIALHTKKGSPRRFFYLRFWDLEEIKSRLPGFVVVEAVPWRFGKLIVFRRAL
jgi:hypothetical protein